MPALSLQRQERQRERERERERKGGWKATQQSTKHHQTSRLNGVREKIEDEADCYSKFFRVSGSLASRSEGFPLQLAALTKKREHTSISIPSTYVFEQEDRGSV